MDWGSLLGKKNRKCVLNSLEAQDCHHQGVVMKCPCHKKSLNNTETHKCRKKTFISLPGSYAQVLMKADTPSSVVIRDSPQWRGQSQIIFSNYNFWMLVLERKEKIHEWAPVPVFSENCMNGPKLWNRVQGHFSHPMSMSPRASQAPLK